jgi:glutamate carboxypeptidase
MNPTEILEYYKIRQGEMVQAIREIVDIESPSHDAVRSREVVDWVERQAKATGVEITIERVGVNDGDHIVISAFPGDGKNTLLLGHTDTVHPVGTNQQIPTRIDDDRFFGCGIFDMKANIVLMFEALRFCAVKGVSPATPVTILLSCDEEVGSHTGRKLVEREAKRAARCLVLEPSHAGKVKTGRKGTGMYILRAHGIPAHAGLEPEKGANAVAELASHIDEIHAIQNAAVGTTVSVTTIKGGTTSNVIPEHAECEVDVRFSMISEGERVDRELRTIRPINERVSLELLGGINRPPLERTDEVIALFENARSIGASFGYEIAETQVGGASDGNFVAAMGVPVLDGLGISGAGAHTLSEHILLSDIANRAALVTLLVVGNES